MDKKEQTLFKELWDRRVFQIIGIYLGAAWAVLEFISSLLVDRFQFSEQLIPVAFITVISLLPSIIMIAWFHGRPGPDKWHSIEKIGIPANLIITIFAVTWAMGSDPLGAEERVSVNTVTEAAFAEEETLISRKSRIAIWNFSVEEDSPELLEKAELLPQMLYFALRQNIAFNLTTRYDYLQNIREKGALNKNVLPLALMREFSREHNFDYFLTGRLNKSETGFQINCRVYDAESFEMRFENTLNSNDIFTAVDSMTYCINEKLGPENMRNTAEFIPVAELLSNDTGALRSFIRGRITLMQNNDMAAAVKAFQSATETDPDFQYAYFELLRIYSMTNQRAETEAVMAPLMDKLYKLPEQDRYFVRYYYYLFRDEVARSEDVLDIWEELFPDDTRPLYRRIWNHYINQGRYSEAVREYEKILHIEPQADELLLAMGDMYFRLREVDMARKYFNDYIEIHPDHLTGYLNLAQLEKDVGNFHEAREVYDKILLMQDNFPAALTAKAEMAISHGEFDNAQALLAKALSFSKTPADSMECLRMLSYRDSFRGNFIGALRYRVLLDNISKRVNSPMVILVDKLQDISMFLDMGEKKIAFDVINEIRKLSPPLNSLYLVGQLEAFITLQDKVNIELTMAEIRNSDLGLFLGRKTEAMLLEGQAMLHEINGEYQRAVLAYEQADTLLPDSRLSFLIPKARNQRLAGDFEAAEKTLREMMTVIPAFPEMHYELAQLRWEQQRLQEAMDHLSIALEVWKNAHPDYPLAREANGLMRRWKIMM